MRWNWMEECFGKLFLAPGLRRSDSLVCFVAHCAQRFIEDFRLILSQILGIRFFVSSLHPIHFGGMVDQMRNATEPKLARTDFLLLGPGGGRGGRRRSEDSSIKSGEAKRRRENLSFIAILKSQIIFNAESRSQSDFCAGRRRRCRNERNVQS